MSSTHIYQGLEGNKNTSRVLRPPGGASSNIFGTDPETSAQAQKPTRKPQDNNIFGSCSGPSTPPAKKENIPTETVEQTPEVKHDSEKAEVKKDAEKAAQSPTKASDEGEEEEKSEGDNNNAKKSEDIDTFAAAQANQRRNQQGSYNPITGAESGPGVHTSTKVRQPPGGASTPLW